MNTKEKIKCPDCGNELTKIKAGRITVDACENGCGGIWFDRLELSEVNEPDEKTGIGLLHIKKNPNKTVELNKKKCCPVCDVPFLTYQISTGHHFIIDECPECSGFWLDDSELAKLRGDSETANIKVFYGVEASSKYSEGNRTFFDKLGRFFIGDRKI